MSSKDEIAALMASEANHEQKITLLKKAVVNVTKQKQAIEQQRDDLAKRLRESEAARTAVQDESAALRSRLRRLEAELQQERQASKSTKFGHHVLKGLSSLMTGVETGGDSAAAISRSPITLNAADVEHVVAENAELHRRIFDAETACEEATRAGQAESMRLSLQLAQVQTEMTELRSLLDAATQACDEANARRDYAAAVANFCRRCLVLRWQRTMTMTRTKKTARMRHYSRTPATASASPHSETTRANTDGCHDKAPCDTDTNRRTIPPQATRSSSSSLAAEKAQASMSRMSAALLPVLALRTGADAVLSVSACQGHSCAESQALVSLALHRFTDTIRTLVRGVTVLMTGLSESLPMQLCQGATVTRRRRYVDKLSHLRLAHKARGEAVLSALQALEDAVGGAQWGSRSRSRSSRRRS